MQRIESQLMSTSQSRDFRDHVLRGVMLITDANQHLVNVNTARPSLPRTPVRNSAVSVYYSKVWCEMFAEFAAFSESVSVLLPFSGAW